MPWTGLKAMLAGVMLAGCMSGEAADTPRVQALSSQIAVFQKNPEIVAFLAEEAAQAGVRAIRPLPPGGLPLPGTETGHTYGVTFETGLVYIDPTTGHGRSILNISHEIAHASAFGGPCGGHDQRWLDTFLAIATRFETRFPGRKWGGLRPTDRVRQERSRYGIGSVC